MATVASEIENDEMRRAVCHTRVAYAFHQKANPFGDRSMARASFLAVRNLLPEIDEPSRLIKTGEGYADINCDQC